MKPAWQHRPEAGNAKAMRLFARTALAVGPRLGRLILVPVSLYFFMVRAEERRASRAFLERVLQRRVTLRDIWRHFWTFSQVILDRAFILSDQTSGMTFETEGLNVLHDALDEDGGCLMMGSHLGSFEASRAIKERRPDVALRIVMDRTVNASATGFLEQLNPELAAGVLDISSEPGTVLKLLEALRSGALVAILADRPRGEEEVMEAEFLGEKACFPTAPHQFAMLTESPLILFWGLHLRAGHYRIIFERLETPAKARRGQREAELATSVQRYADRLAHYARQSPYNWFNFYDYWRKD